jgi:P pilus assembly chaperone PapD
VPVKKTGHPWMMIAATLVGLTLPTAASADLVLSDLIVDLQPGKQAREDVEVWNNGPERAYVAIEPREILNPGTSKQSDRHDPDPAKLGLLVGPSRMILEPGQRKLVRIASLASGADREHVYRVTVKPVVGGVQSEDSGLKVLVGYDVLVLVRPTQTLAGVSGTRSDRKLALSNTGNVSVELVNGRQCNTDKSQCSDLPGKRLYPGATWTVELSSDRPVEYTLKWPGRTERREF